MHRHYLECWPVLFLLCFLTHIACLYYFFEVRSYTSSWIFLVSVPFIELLLSSTLINNIAHRTNKTHDYLHYRSFHPKYLKDPFPTYIRSVWEKSLETTTTYKDKFINLTFLTMRIPIRLSLSFVYRHIKPCGSFNAKKVILNFCH